MIYDQYELESRVSDRGDTFDGPVDIRVRWKAITDFCKDGEGHFFDDDTMRFFNSELDGVPRLGVDGYIYGVVSSKGPHSPRTYQVVRVTANGNTHHPHKPEAQGPDSRMYQFTVLDAAEGVQDQLLRGKEDPSSWNWY